MCDTNCHKECCASCENKDACMEYSHTIYVICPKADRHYHIKQIKDVPFKQIMEYLRNGKIGDTVFFTRDRAKEVMKWKEKQTNE